MTAATDPFRQWDCAYVLGMLSAQERRAFEQHLMTCPSCTAAVAELAGMPGILRTLDTTEALALLEAPTNEHLRSQRHEPDLVQRLSRSVRTQRRRHRGALVAAASGIAVVMLVGGIALGTQIATAPELAPVAPTSEPPVGMLAMTQVEPGVMTATLALTAKAWGTRLDWKCAYLDDAWADGLDAPSYDMVVTDATGTQTIVATWTAAGAGADGLVASTSVPTGDIRNVEIRPSGSTTALVRTEPEPSGS